MRCGFGKIQALLLIGALGACDTTPAPAPVTIDAEPRKGLPRSGGRLPGVELVTWRVAESSELDETLLALTDPGLDATANTHLARNAVLTCRLEETRLPELITALGGIKGSMSTWCGQVLDWRDLREVRFRRNLVQIDDTTTLLDGGRLGMAGRAWVEPDLEGARLHLELVPRFTADRAPYSSLLKRETPKPLLFDALAQYTDLRAGEVMLITCSELPPPPPAPDPATDPPAGDDPDPTDDPALDSPMPRSVDISRRSRELGHALFSLAGEPAERVILVVVPRIPPSMIPDSADGPDRTRNSSLHVETSR